MHITLYQSSLCPRCRFARKYLSEVLQSMPDVTFEEIDILSSPVKTWTAGVRMIPAIKINGSTLSSVYLTKERISQFIRLQDQNSPTP